MDHDAAPRAGVGASAGRWPAEYGARQLTLPDGAGDEGVVEPFAMRLDDADGRWRISIAHEDERVRGVPRRTAVARCSCGWVQGFNARGYVGAGPGRLLAHLRSHQLAARAPLFRGEQRLGEWERVALLAGRAHCADASCHRLGAGETRTQLGFAEPCAEHGGALYDRVYHWAEHDPEDHSGVPLGHEPTGLRGPDGLFWHLRCAPLGGRRLFGFLRDKECE